MKEAWMFQALLTLMSWGFTIKRVLADREFSTYDVLAVLGFLGVPYTGPMKRTPTIRKLIDQYINVQSKAVVSVQIQPNITTRFKVGAIPVHVIFKAEAGKSARDIRAALAAGKITRAEARKHIHVFITTEKDPRRAASLISWGMRIANIFRYRMAYRNGISSERWIHSIQPRALEQGQDILACDGSLRLQLLESAASTSSQVKGCPEIVE
jgi:hypothetical protein